MAFVEKWKNIENKAKKYSHFTMILAVLNVFLMILTAYSFTHQKVVIQLPPTRLTESIVYSSNEVSRSLFEMWGKYIAATLGNYSSENISDNIYILLNMTHPENMKDIKPELVELEKHVKENRVRQAFYPEWEDMKLQIKGNYSQMIIHGEAFREVGTNLQEYDIKYTLRMAVINGHMYLTYVDKEVDKRSTTHRLKAGGL